LIFRLMSATNQKFGTKLTLKQGEMKK